MSEQESVALVDDRGSVVGSAPRSVVRRDNLLHMAAGVLVRNRRGEVYVHRRTTTKDIFPGAHDCLAGGTVCAGESPLEAAERELAEELGVRDVALRPLLRGWYADGQTRYLAYVYETTYDGAIRHQPEEVAWGRWMRLRDLRTLLDDPRWSFVPDTRELVARWLQQQTEPWDARPLDEGWDNHAWVVDDRWVDREPRRPDVADRLLMETRLLPWLGPRLPVPVPQPCVLVEEPLRVRHRLLAGDPADPEDPAAPAALAPMLAGFLTALHGVDTAVCLELGVPSAASAAEARRETLERMRAEVLPLLDGDHRTAGRRLLDQAASPPAGATLVHGDLGPEHVLVADGGCSGVIDWGDAHLGDPAMDLAWPLHGTPPEFARAVAVGYRPDADLVARAAMWWRLAPWHEVLYGLGTGPATFVESGLRGVVDRLR